MLIKFKVHTVGYGPSFSPLIYVPRVKNAGHESQGKKQGSVTYSTEREDEVK